MRKKLTLDETWNYCLEMWKWIATVAAKDECVSVTTLKRRWLKKNGFGWRTIGYNCLFCEYDAKREDNCAACPGRIVDPTFHCGDLSYCWKTKPVDFCKKLIETHKKYKASEAIADSK